MGWFFLVLVVLVFFVVIVIFAKLGGKRSDVSTGFQYQKLDVLFTPAERSFLGVLKLAVNDDAEVFGKVRVADVITPKKGLGRSLWQKSFNKISAKHFDFLLCNKDDLSPLCAIELNDSSHNNKKRQERDDFLRGACLSADLPLVQIKAKAAYNMSDIRDVVAIYMPTHMQTKKVEDLPVDNLKSDDLQSDRVCPKCHSVMAMKVAKKGSNAGNTFWACSGFPQCRYIEEV